MIRIAVIDDMCNICSYIEDVLLSFGKKIGEKIEVEPYMSTKKFILALKNREVFDLIFLDIEIDDKTGIDIANYIRNTKDDEYQAIVYISGNTSYSLQLFETHPLDFLVKPLSDEKIEKVVMKYMKIYKKISDIFTYTIGADSFKIKMKDIIYFIVENHMINMHTKDTNIKFRNSLSKLEKQLNKNKFLRISKQILVNTIHVKEYHFNEVILYNGAQLPIGRSYHDKVTEFKLNEFREELK